MQIPEFRFLKIYQPLFNTKARYIDIWGGRGRGGSHCGSDYFLFLITKEEYFRGFVSRAVFSDIKTTIWQELLDRIDENETLNIEDFDIEKGKQMKYLPTGNTITSKGFRKSSSNRTANLKGFAGATHIVIDEAEEIAEDEAIQLDVTFRTIKSNIQIIRIFNPPPKTHWIIRDFYDLTPILLYDSEGKEIEDYYQATQKGRNDHLSIFGTYKDNAKHNNTTSKKLYEKFFYTNVDYYFSQIKGYVSGCAKGLIMRFGRHWFLYDELPDYDFYEILGLDFGGGGKETDEADGSSKTVLLKLYICKSNKSIYVKLYTYKGYVTTDDLCIDIDAAGGRQLEILADNARKDKCIELQNKGYCVIPAKSKEGQSNQVKTGYDIVKEWKVFVHKDDKSVQIEFNNHKWKTLANKELANQPEDRYKDVMDALRYATVYYHLNYIF